MIRKPGDIFIGKIQNFFFEKPKNPKPKQNVIKKILEKPKNPKPKQNVIFQLRQLSIFFCENFRDWFLGK